MFLMSRGLFADGPAFFVRVGVELLALAWIWGSIRYGTVKLSRAGLVVHGYGRATRLQLADLVAFDSSTAVRGAGHRREVLFATRSNGEQARFDCVHGPPGSLGMRELVDELNEVLQVLCDVAGLSRSS